METTTSLSSRPLQYYVITKQWLSDLEFFKIEITFFQQLIGGHFVQKTNEGYVVELSDASNLLAALNRGIQQVEVMVNEQYKQLELMAEDIIPEDVEALKYKQIKLEIKTAAITGEYRKFKKQLFVLIERIMKLNNLHAN